MVNTRREEEVLNLIDTLKRQVTGQAANTVKSLEREFSELTTEITALKMVRAEPAFVSPFHLTKYQDRMMRALSEAGDRGLTKEGLMAAVYFDRDQDAWPNTKILDVWVCRIRKGLSGTPYKVESVWGRGFRLVKTNQLAA